MLFGIGLVPAKSAAGVWPMVLIASLPIPTQLLSYFSGIVGHNGRSKLWRGAQREFHPLGAGWVRALAGETIAWPAETREVVFSVAFVQ